MAAFRNDNKARIISSAFYPDYLDLNKKKFIWEEVRFEDRIASDSSQEYY